MTNHVVRLYALTLSALGLLAAWAGLAAEPWTQPPPSAATSALSAYEQRLRVDAALVEQLAAHRSTRPAPAVRLVTLPPLTTTRTS